MKHILAIGDVADDAPSHVLAPSPAKVLVKTATQASDVRKAAGPAVWVQQGDGSWAIRWRGNDTWWDLSARYLQAGNGEHGLDFVLLVDMSASMHRYSNAHDTEHAGSDPHRLRWDTAQLVVDLLTKDDRILILPFNTDCPAQFEKKSKEKIPIPGILEPEMHTSIRCSDRSSMPD